MYNAGGGKLGVIVGGKSMGGGRRGEGGDGIPKGMGAGTNGK